RRGAAAVLEWSFPAKLLTISLTPDAGSSAIYRGSFHRTAGPTEDCSIVRAHRCRSRQLCAVRRKLPCAIVGGHALRAARPGQAIAAAIGVDGDRGLRRPD